MHVWGRGEVWHLGGVDIAHDGDGEGAGAVVAPEELRHLRRPRPASLLCRGRGSPANAVGLGIVISAQPGQATAPATENGTAGSPKVRYSPYVRVICDMYQRVRCRRCQSHPCRL